MQNKLVKKSQPAVKKSKGQKCVNYLDLPVCPNCGSPNLHELEREGNVTNCICDRCYTPCWFDDSFSTEGRDTVRYTDNLKIVESTKKSKNVQVSKKAPINKRFSRTVLTNAETNEAREISNDEFLELLDRNPSSRTKFGEMVMRYAPQGGNVGYRDTIDGVNYIVEVFGEPSEPLWASVRKSTKKSKSVKKNDSEPRYKIEFMYQPYDGEYTAEECGKNVEVMLKAKEPSNLYNPHFTFYRTDLEFKASAKKSQPATKSFNDMVKEQRNKNVKKTYPEDLTDEQAQTVDGYRLWANSIGEEIWNVVRSVTGLRSRSNMELDSSWKEVSDLLIQAKEKADALVNVEIELR